MGTDLLAIKMHISVINIQYIIVWLSAKHHTSVMFPIKHLPGCIWVKQNLENIIRFTKQSGEQAYLSYFQYEQLQPTGFRIMMSKDLWQFNKNLILNMCN